MVEGAWSFAAGYLLGSIPVGLWIGRGRHGIDVRTRGSGSTGATNVLRTLGARPAALVAVLDFAKGSVAAAGAAALAGPGIGAPGWAAAAAGFGAVVGHVWPVWAGFRGGKGVATAAGAALVVAPSGLLAAVAAFGLVLAAGRRVSLASLVASWTLPAWVAIAGTAPGRPFAPALTYGLAAAATILLAHRANVRSLVAGREPPIGS